MEVPPGGALPDDAQIGIEQVGLDNLAVAGLVVPVVVGEEEIGIDLLFGQADVAAASLVLVPDILVGDHQLVVDLVALQLRGQAVARLKIAEQHHPINLLYYLWASGHVLWDRLLNPKS